VRVFDAAVKKAYKGKKKIAWMEVFAGRRRSSGLTLVAGRYGGGVSGIFGRDQGPLTTPVGAGFAR